MLGFLVQWAHAAELVMFPVLAVMDVRLVQREEREMLAAFREAFACYAARTPAWVPNLFSKQPRVILNARLTVDGPRLCERLK
jgi:protein-S-isoprenylcysteine O-methyltransferase Ste14